ncbi:PREDICTED: uncharacterized protein LOC109153162 isoform X4 [Ipomoea nil]|uniref:uncharacterized protein LOC109153162 isoform X4 n=1 Tax=Ipomoea nil TaxID=35883 RepID=UPI000901A3AD|nr:PREDICTED: uncharacterized protein LOC109153162 isoform X4 [Ipomoea nil]
MESSFPSSLPPFTRSPHSHLPLITAILPRRRKIAPPLSTITAASCSSQAPLLSARTVSISYSELKDKNADLSSKIEEGFGVNGLGLLSISDVQLWMELWKREARWKARYPSYCRANIWPRTALPELEIAFKALGKLILNVGLLLAHHCDRYVSSRITTNENKEILQTLLPSRCHKGRLLYYFPTQNSSSALDDGSVSSWSGWHTDYASLTGLTCEMFTRDDVEIPCSDNAAGLYIMSRTGQVVKPEYGEDEIAYLVGETGEILSRHLLCATPHCVRAPKGVEASSVGRSTYVLFMQPNWDEKFNFSELAHIHEELRHSNHPLTYGEYSERLHDKHY